MEINSSPALEPQLFAMKKAIDVQGQAVLKILESIQPVGQNIPSSGSELTGLGTQLDIKA